MPSIEELTRLQGALSLPLEQSDNELGPLIKALIAYVGEQTDDTTALAARVTTLETGLTALTARVTALGG